MKIFFLKVFLLVCLMFICVLTGMQLAGNGIAEMRGYEDPGIAPAIEVKEGDGGKVETSFLGNRISSHDLEAKKKQLEEMETYNLFSSLGRTLADSVGAGVGRLLDTLER